MQPDVAAALAQRIRDQHGGRPTYLSATYVAEKIDGQRPWQGLVYVFDLEEHPTASRCYGLASLGEGGRVELSVMLHDHAVQSPQAAVRAYVLAKGLGLLPPRTRERAEGAQ